MKKNIALIIVALSSVLWSGSALSQEVVAVAKASQSEVLIVSTVEREPFTFFGEDGQVTGFSADLWVQITERNGWKFSWRREKGFLEMVDAVTKGHSQAAISNISLTSDREKRMDFSHPIYDSGLQIIVPDKKGGISIFKLIWQSGALQLIAAAVVVLLIIAHILWFFERNTPNDRHDYFRDDYFGGLWDAFWWAFVVMTMGGFEGEVPASKVSRVLAMFWIVASLFFVSTLTAKITTSLTVDQLTGDINSYKDLRGKRVGVGENSAMSSFLDAKNIPYRRYKDYKAALAAVENGALDATIGDAPVAQYYASHKGAGKVRLAGPVFSRDKFAIALPTGSPLIEPINIALLKLHEDGTYAKLLRKWFGGEN